MRCKHCKSKFTPKKFLQKFCLETDECISAFVVYAKEVTEKNKTKLWVKEKRELKEKHDGIPEYKKLLEKEINKICCLIDKWSGCISCGGHTTPQAGHMHSVQSNGSLRYNLDNLHLQDFGCNCKKGSNMHQYDLGLIKTYGKEYWEYVKFDIVAKFPLLKMAIFDYKEKITLARQVVKHLKLENKPYNAVERLELRKEYNEFLGIYK